jgi:hypothetical protein
MTSAQSGSASRIAAFALAVAGIALSFLASSGPIQWQDNGVYLAQAARGVYFSETLDPLSHPLYHFVAASVFNLFGLEALSLLNSILLIPLAYAVCRLCRSLGMDERLGWLAAAAAIFSHALFWVSTKVEVYLLHTLLVVLTYWVYFSPNARLAAPARLILIGLLTGLCATVHQLTFIVLLPLYVDLLLRDRLLVLVTVPGFLLGLVTAYPAMINDLGSGLSLLAVARRFLTGAQAAAGVTGLEGNLFRLDLIASQKSAVVVLLLSLAGPPLVGLCLYPKNRNLRLLWWAAALNFFFAISYDVHDRFAFFLPGAVFASILGIKQLDERVSAGAVPYLATLCAPAILITAYAFYSAGAIRLPTHAAALPYRDDVRYFLAPYLPDRSAELFVENYTSVVPENALVLADWTPLGALRSAQASGRFLGRALQDCAIMDPAKDMPPSQRVFLVRDYYCRQWAEKFTQTPISIGYELLPSARD